MSLYTRGHAPVIDFAAGECEGELFTSPQSLCARRGDDRFARAGAETLAQALDGEAMDIVEIGKQLYDMWDSAPDDVKDSIKEIVRRGWEVRGPLLHRLLVTSLGLVVGSRMPLLQAVQTAAVQLKVPPRRGVPEQKGLSAQQVRDYHRRQQQRGRRPGQNPQQRARLQREAEFMFGPSKKERAEDAMKRFNRAEAALKRLEDMRNRTQPVATSPVDQGAFRTLHSAGDVARAQHRLKRIEKGIELAKKASGQASQDLLKAIS